MEGNDITGREERIHIHIGDPGDILFRAAVRQDLAAEGVCDGGSAEADGSGTDDTEFFALQLKAHQSVLGAFLPHHVVAGDHVPVQGNDHAKYQVGHGGGGVARAVADQNAVGLTCVHGDMVHAGEGHRQHL